MHSVMSVSSPVKKVKIWWCKGCCLTAVGEGMYGSRTSSMPSLQQPTSLNRCFPAPAVIK